MKEFCMAALPWILCGVAVAIICSRLGTKPPNNQKKNDIRLVIGMALGLVASIVFNNMGVFINRGVGYAVGPLWGMAISMILGDEKNEE